MKSIMIDQLWALCLASPLNPWKSTVQYKRNTYISVSGNKDANIYYIKSGSVRVFIDDEFEEHTIRLGYPGSIITALDTFISGEPSQFYLQALKRCELEVATQKDFMRFIESDPKHLQLWLQINQQLVLQCIEREIDLLTNSPMERYKRVLARSPWLFQEIPAKYIASYLRMTPETLSRLKKA
jgi:CRP-like cAMP-binding protein